MRKHQRSCLACARFAKMFQKTASCAERRPSIPRLSPGILKIRPCEAFADEQHPRRAIWKQTLSGCPVCARHIWKTGSTVQFGSALRRLPWEYALPEMSPGHESFGFRADKKRCCVPQTSGNISATERHLLESPHLRHIPYSPQAFAQAQRLSYARAPRPKESQTRFLLQNRKNNLAALYAEG